jgi:hypothetical protein
MVFRFPQRQQVYLFTKTQTPTLAPAQSPGLWTTAVLSPGKRVAGIPFNAIVKTEHIPSLSHTSS